MMQDFFYRLSDECKQMLKGDEFLSCYYEEEDSDFCRFNHGKIRQPGHVLQRDIDLRLASRGRQAKVKVALTGQFSDDRRRLAQAVEGLRLQVAAMPSEDPYLLYSQDVFSTEVIKENQLPSPDDAIAQCLNLAEGLDLVGIWASGVLRRGFSNSLGQRNWFETSNFNLDFSCYHSGDKAVKSGYAGFCWQEPVLAQKLSEVRSHLKVVERPTKAIEPGRYRVFLAPQAVSEIFSLLNWNSFSSKGQRTEQSSLRMLVQGERSLSPLVSVQENTAGGVAANFDPSGFTKPDAVDLIVAGKHAAGLVSARTAKEYGLTPTGASEDEQCESIDLAAGELAAASVLKELDTGIMLNNLWYLNFSDRQSCRITGMSRFASFWVENGQIVAPISVMRFDETFYRMFGDNLIGLTKEREFMPSSSTYFSRHTESQNLPGALVDQFTLTL